MGPGNYRTSGRMLGSFTPALQRFAIICATFSCLLVIVGFLVFFSGSPDLPERFMQIFAGMVLVSAGALDQIPPYLLRKST